MSQTPDHSTSLEALSSYLFDLADVLFLHVAHVSLGEQLVGSSLLLLLLAPNELLRQVGIAERVDIVCVPGKNENITTKSAIPRNRWSNSSRRDGKEHTYQTGGSGKVAKGGYQTLGIVRVETHGAVRERWT